MFDKGLLDSFNAIFGGNQVSELLRIKSEVDLFGFQEFANIAFEQIQGVTYEPADRDNVENRVIKNAIFTVIQFIRIDEDLDAFRLMLLTLDAWRDVFDRKFTDFSSSQIISLNDLLNQTFYYSHEEEEYDYKDPQVVTEETERLRDYMFFHEEFLSVLNENEKKEELYLWDCVVRQAPSKKFYNKFGEYSDWHLLPDFSGQVFQKTVYFTMSILCKIWIENGNFDFSNPHRAVRSEHKFRQLVEVFFEDEIKELEKGPISNLGDVDYEIKSVFDLLNTSLKIYKDIIDNVMCPEPKDWKTYENLVSSLV